MFEKGSHLSNEVLSGALGLEAELDEKKEDIIIKKYIYAMGNVTPENLNVSRNNLSLQLIIKKLNV